MLVVFEGIDGCGKTTQAKLLFSFLKKSLSRVLFKKYPSLGKIGSLIRKNFMYQDSSSEVDSFLFLADMFEQDKNVIRPALKKGYFIICDRYYPSFMCYQKAQGFNTKLLKDFYLRLAKPDIVFLLRCEAGVCYKRNSKKKRSKYETLTFLKSAAKEYERMRNDFSDKLIVLDANKSIKELHSEVLKEVNNLL